MGRRLAILIALLAFGAVKADGGDTPTIPGGRVESIIVTRSGAAWLMCWGLPFFAESIDSDWHSGRSLFTEGLPEAGVLRFFDRNTGVLFGRFRKPGVSIGGGMGGGLMGGMGGGMMGGMGGGMMGGMGGTMASPYTDEGYYYRTEDAGRTWTKRTHGTDFWVTDAHVDENGHAWVVGMGGPLRYSEDYGKTWRTLGPRFCMSIHMLDTRNGIAAEMYNDLWTTANNWESCSKIDTPLDQKKYVKGYLFDDQIEKVRLWGDYIVVEQGPSVFYTARDTIDWQLLGPGLLAFEVDPKTGKLLGVGKDLRVVSFTNPGEWTYLHEERLRYRPRCVTVQDGVFYAIDAVDAKERSGGLYWITENEFSRRIPCTADRHRKPWSAEAGPKHHWGSCRYELLISDDQGQTWYRENILDFEIRDIHVLDDDTAILSDGQRRYRYSLASHTCRLHERERPLATFLQSPITEVVIKNDYKGNLGDSEDSVSYTRLKHPTNAPDQSGLLYATEYVEKDAPDYTAAREKSTPYRNTISIEHLTDLLKEVNVHPNRIPPVEEFGIDANDIERYRVMVKESFEGDCLRFYANSIEDAGFFRSIPTRPGALDSTTVKAMLLSKWPSGFTTAGHGSFSVQIRNEDGQTLTMYDRSGCFPRAWCLPWQCEYDGLRFNCYHLGLSHLIKDSIPDGFPRKLVFDNAWLIRNVAEYLYRAEHPF